jgi:hypothetical protein
MYRVPDDTVSVVSACTPAPYHPYDILDDAERINTPPKLVLVPPDITA